MRDVVDIMQHSSTFAPLIDYATVVVIHLSRSPIFRCPFKIKPLRIRFIPRAAPCSLHGLRKSVLDTARNEKTGGQCNDVTNF